MVSIVAGKKGLRLGIHYIVAVGAEVAEWSTLCETREVSFWLLTFIESSGFEAFPINV